MSNVLIDSKRSFQSKSFDLLNLFLPEDQENGRNTIDNRQIQNKNAVWLIEERSTF